MSETSNPHTPSSSPPRANLEDVIAAHGAQIEKTQVDLHQELADRVDKLEVLMEQLGKTDELVKNLNDYVLQLRTEMQAIFFIRALSVGGAVIFICLINWALYRLVFKKAVIYWLQEPYYKGAVVVAVLAASVVLISIMLKGAFYALSDKSKDEHLPPHLKELLDAVKMAVGK